MSHYVKLEMEGLTDQACLAKGLQDMGLHVEVGDVLTLKGWGSQKSLVQVKLPAGTSGAGNHYDAGFAKDLKGSFQLVVESMDKDRLNGAWVNRVRQSYKRAEALRLARCRNLKVVEDKQVNGRVRLVFSS